MQYTVWSRGELIGTTTLDFFGLGFDAQRSGDFFPNEHGDTLMRELASDSHCMRAYFYRNYRDAEGKSVVDPEYMNSDWFGDVAEHLHACSHFMLEVRDESGTSLPLAEIGIQDKIGYFAPPDPEVMARIAEEDRERERMADLFGEDPAIEAAVQHDIKIWEEMRAKAELRMEGLEYDEVPCDITVPVGWGYEGGKGDNEMGSGWCAALRDLPDYPRFQIHLLLHDSVAAQAVQPSVAEGE